MLVAVGLNQKGATIADRESLALAAGDAQATLAGYGALDGVDEVAMLFTCCRVEIFAVTACPAAAVLALRYALEARAGRELPLFELQGEEAFRHLVRVASSLESAIEREPQIFSQMKDAFQRAAEAGTAGVELSGVLSRALAAATRVRTEAAVGRAGISWGHAAAALAGKVLGPLAGRRAAEADAIVADEVKRFARSEAERRAAPLIEELRSRASAIAKEEVERTLRRLGEDPELARRLDAMAGSIVAKILHAPSARLREAVGEGGSGDPLVLAAVQIFGLSRPVTGP